MRALLVVVLFGMGCTNVHVNRATLLASTAALACDWGQTRRAASDGWRYAIEENPVMGSTPSTRTVDAYFAGAAFINIAVWALLPSKYRSVIPTGIAVGQTWAIVDNTIDNNNNIHGGVSRDVGVCGL